MPVITIEYDKDTTRTWYEVSDKNTGLVVDLLLGEEPEVTYRIVGCNYISDLECKVVELMAFGWKPIGGMIPYDAYYRQTMIRCSQEA